MHVGARVDVQVGAQMDMQADVCLGLSPRESRLSGTQVSREML